MTEKLPTDAFALYVALGPSRSYAAVGENYGVSKALVGKRAQEEDWQARLERIEGGVREAIDSKAVATLASVQDHHLQSQRDLHAAIREVMTPDRLKALLVSLLKAAIQKDNVTAARILLERVLGRPRSEPLHADALALPGGLQSAADVRGVANSILEAVARGTVTPEDAQRTATVVESARKAIETEELERRLAELERRYEEGKDR